jgi:RNA polymerase sigma-70 factor (ECF subfamily)
MPRDEQSSIHTRPSFLNRLKAGDDTTSWEEFYRVYGKLVRDFAVQAGLTETEADEVVQETAIGMARHLPEFDYDPKVCRFKTWLLNQTTWRIKDQLRKRKKGPAVTSDAPASGVPKSESSDDASRTATVYRVSDTTAVDLDTLFETEWRKNQFACALERVKGKFSLKQFQIFDLNVIKEWPAGDVARSLGVSLANVYVTKHRIAAAAKKELKRLEQELEQRINRKPGS